MKWKKTPINLKDVDTLSAQLAEACKQAQDGLDDMKCLFKKKNDTILYLYTIFDWIDAKIPAEAIENFILYQPLNG